MPAITADTLTLPRVGPAGPADTERPVRSITTGPRGYEGEGFPVVRAFAGVSTAALDPFVHMDQMGEVEYQPGEPRGTDWHPHRGFETVTYMIDGKFAHQDSHGGGGLITDGATQWMTAGSGILHIETPPAELVESGGALPRHPALGESAEERQVRRRPGIRPSKATTPSCSPPTTAERWSASSPVRSTATADPGVTHTPITLAHATIRKRGPTQHSVAARLQRAGLCVVRAVDTSVRSAHPIHQGQLAVLGSGDRITRCRGPVQDSIGTTAIDVLILGGQPIREPVFHYGPFVMNSKAELIEAIEDYQSGKFGSVPPNALMPHRGGGTLY